jgi:hypothetical protein
MPIVSFPWDAQLVSIRREAVPRARWDKATRAWSMTETEADAFLQVAQRRMSLARVKCSVTVDQTVWVLGFAHGTPYRLDTTGRRLAEPTWPTTDRSE